ncbi:MAG: ubiquinone/menaquinone biosynthesis methyltransferase [Thermodesulforhabdaceae bacterium]|jgi:demethylmenaquinone methyltransferase/2-methoxy-6-polyprenyl-1,4-benzoquinol methylase
MCSHVSLDKNPQRIGAMFNRIAPVYDFLNHMLSSGMDLWWRHRAVSSLQLSGRAIVVDVATGTGDLAFSLLRRNPSAMVIGVDIARAMLDRAVLKGKKYHGYQAIQADGQHLPVKSGSADAVMIAYGIRNMPGATDNPENLSPVLREFHRVLKPSGELLILEFSIPSKPLFRSVYLFYFQKLLPWLGGLVSGDREAYSYLPTSVQHFISPEDMVCALEREEFKVVEVHRFLAGVSYFVKARKISR